MLILMAGPAEIIISSHHDRAGLGTEQSFSNLTLSLFSGWEIGGHTRSENQRDFVFEHHYFLINIIYSYSGRDTKTK